MENPLLTHPKRIVGVTLANEDSHRALSVKGGILTLNRHSLRLALRVRFAADPLGCAVDEAEEAFSRFEKTESLQDAYAQTRSSTRSGEVCQSELHRRSRSLPEDLFFSRADGGQEAYDIILLGASCLYAVRDEDVPEVLQHLVEHSSIKKDPGLGVIPDGSPNLQQVSTLDKARRVLQNLRSHNPTATREALAVLTRTLCGQQLIRALYFGEWTSFSNERPQFDWPPLFHVGVNTALLDPRAFLQDAHGRKAMNLAYHLLFVGLMLRVFYCDSTFTEFRPSLDLPLVAFLVGGLVEESSEFWADPEYLLTAWNRLDCGAMVCLATYLFVMDVEQVSRAALALATLLQMIRLLGSFRNSENWPVEDTGMLIRTTFAMFASVSGFLTFYLFVMIAFTVSFYFLYHDEVDSFSEMSRQLKGGHAGGGTHTGGDAENAPFRSIGHTFLWLFDASLGNFDFAAVEHSMYAEWGVILLVAWLVCANVVLLNFLVAILSRTFEEHSQDSRELHFMDMAEEALTCMHVNDPWTVPWLPRPANLVNLVILWVFRTIAFFCRVVVRGRTDACAAAHLRTQLYVRWLLGNVFVVGGYLALRLILMPIVALAAVLVSPILASCCVVNVLNGNVAQEWSEAMQQKDAHKGYNDNRSNFMRRLRTFSGNLTPMQSWVLMAPVILVFLACLYFFHSFVSSLKRRRFEPWWGFLVALEQKAPPWWLEHRESMHAIIDAVLCLTLVTAIAQLRILGGLFDGTVCNGIRSLQIGAGVSDAFNPEAHTRMVQLEDLQSDEEDADSSRAQNGMAAEWATHDVKDWYRKPELSQGTTYANFGLLATSSSPELDADTSCKKTVVPLRLPTFMKYFLEPPPGMQELICMAIDLIYTEGLHHSFQEMALCMKMEDWFWIACSLIWCIQEQADDEGWEFRLMEREHASLKPSMRSQFVSHPQLGLYITDLGEGRSDVFFEDFFWAVYHGHFSWRRISIEALLPRICDATPKARESCTELEAQVTRVAL